MQSREATDPDAGWFTMSVTCGAAECTKSTVPSVQPSAVIRIWSGAGSSFLSIWRVRRRSTRRLHVVIMTLTRMAVLRVPASSRAPRPQLVELLILLASVVKHEHFRRLDQQQVSSALIPPTRQSSMNSFLRLALINLVRRMLPSNQRKEWM